VESYHSDTDGLGDYTYTRKTSARDAPQVKEEILKAMEGFVNAQVSHIKSNEYKISTDGPDANTSVEMRNLAQMGENSPFTAKLNKSDNWFAY